MGILLYLQYTEKKQQAPTPESESGDAHARDDLAVFCDFEPSADLPDALDASDPLACFRAESTFHRTRQRTVPSTSVATRSGCSTRAGQP